MKPQQDSMEKNDVNRGEVSIVVDASAGGMVKGLESSVTATGAKGDMAAGTDVGLRT